MSTEESPSTQYRITVRFGDQIMQAGFTAVPNLLLNHYVALDITPAELVFILHIWQYWWNVKDPYPALRTVAEKMGKDLRQTRRYAEGLKTKNLLKVRERTAPGKGQITSEYDFSPLLERLLEQAPGEPGTQDDDEQTPRTKMTGGARTKMTGGPRSKMSYEEYTGEEDEIKEDPDLISKETNGNLHNELSTFNGKRTVRKKINSMQINSGAAAVEAIDEPLHPTGWAAAGSVLGTRLPQALATAGRESGAPRGRPPKPTPLIEDTVSQFALQLHDDAPRSSVTRAMRLFQASGLSESDFVYHVLHPAKSTVWQHSDVKRRSTGDAKLSNRMPLFFAEVERQLGQRDAANWTHQRGVS